MFLVPMFNMFILIVFTKVIRPDEKRLVYEKKKN